MKKIYANGFYAWYDKDGKLQSEPVEESHRRLRTAYAKACAESLMGDPESAEEYIATCIETSLANTNPVDVDLEFKEEFPDAHAKFWAQCDTDSIMSK